MHEMKVSPPPAASLPSLLASLSGSEQHFLSGKRDRGEDLESAVRIFLEFLRGRRSGDARWREFETFVAREGSLLEDFATY